MDPNNPNKLIAALWEHKREPWFFNSGGEGSGIHITYDGGENWKKISPQDGLPEGDLGRIGLAIASNKPQIVYALVEAKKNGLYKSIDGGHKWEKVSENMDEIGNRPFYYADLYVDPKNENRIYSIFTYVNVSEDGGKSFKQLMPAYGVSNGVHPDHHAWWIHPENGNFMIDGNDGGLNITKDGGSTWRFIGNLPVAQFYHISVDDEIPYNVYGGMQDNGSWRGPAYVWRDQGIRNSYWQEISFGDGFDVVPDPDNSRYGWSMSQQGFVSRYDWKTGNNYTVRPTHPNPDINLRFNWNAAINIDPVDKSTLYFGSQFVHKSTDKGETWSIISPDLTTNDPEKLRQHESGGLTMDATGAENHCTILVIEPSLVEKNMLWIGTDDGRIHYTRNGGSDWIEVTKNIKDLPKGSWITQIKTSKTKKGEALLVANDYRRFNYTPYAYRTTNYGKTWKRIVDKDDTESYTLCIVEDEKEPNLMFLGTDDGLYISIDAGNEWTKWTNGFPTVSVKDLVIHPREDDLIIGTFGRAAWILDDIRPLREFAKNTKITKDNIKLFEPPTAYMAAYQQPTGSRFGGDALYHGTNRGYGARFAYYFNSKSEEERDTVVQWDTLKLQIFDQERLIRTLKQKVPKENGIKYWTWYLDEKGVEYPSKSTTKTKREPSGTRVLKGTYKAVLNYGNLSSETSIRVENDPRLDVNDEAQRAIYLTLKRLESYLSKATEATKQLLQSKKIAETFIKSLKETDEKGFTQEIEETEEIKGRIEELLVLFFGKVDERQGITSDPNVSVLERLGTANYYVSSRQNGVTSTEQTLIENVKSALNKALNQVNLFFETDWDKFQKQSEKINLSPFKAVKVIRLEE